MVGLGSIYLLWQAWKGWRMGLARAVAVLGGLVAGVVVGSASAGDAAESLRAFVPLPDAVLGLIGGAAVGLGVFIGCVALSAFLLKRTAHQRGWMARTVYGAGGAAVGVAAGLVVLWALAIVIRLAGALGSGNLAAPAARSPGPGAPPAAPDPRERPGAAFVVRLERSLDLGLGRVILDGIDPLPASAYRSAALLGRVAAQPVALARVVDHPAVRRFAVHPKVSRLLADENVRRLLGERDLLGLLAYGPMRDAFNDPDVGALARAIPIEETLASAVAPTAAELTAPRAQPVNPVPGTSP